MGTKLEHVTFYINGDPIDGLSDISEVTESNGSETYVSKLSSDEVTFYISAESKDIQNLRNHVAHTI